MGFTSLVNEFKSRVLDVAIHNRMQVALENGVKAAQAASPVDTGKMKSLISGYYNQSTRTATILGEASYTAFQEQGFTSRSGRKVPGRHFLAAGLAAMARTWGGNVEVQFPTLAPKYHERVTKFGSGKIGRAKVVVGHRKPRRPK